MLQKDGRHKVQKNQDLLKQKATDKENQSNVIYPTKQFAKAFIFCKYEINNKIVQ